MNLAEREAYILQQQIFITASVVIFSIVQDTLCVILMQRGYEPYQGWWMLPSGYVKNDLSAPETLQQKIFTKVGLHDIPLHEVGVFSEPHRDPRRRVICLAYMSVGVFHDIKKYSQYGEVAYHSMKELPVLAFDHTQIIKRAYSLLREQMATSTIAQHFLPKYFPLASLRRVYDTILGTHTDMSNFRKYVLSHHLIIPTGKQEKNVAHRPATLYKFSSFSH